MSRKAAIVAGWTLAALVSAGAHAGAALWLAGAAPTEPPAREEPGFFAIEFAALPQPPAAPPETLPPAVASVFREAAPGEEAVEEIPQEELPEQEIVEDAPEAVPQETVQETVRETSEQKPDPAPGRPVQEVLQELVEEVVEEAVQEVAAPPATTGALAPVPPRRPRDLADAPVPVRVARERPRRDASIDSAASGAQAQEAPRAAAARAGRARATADLTPADLTPAWRARLAAHLERHRRYPASARASGVEGVVHLHFTIDPSGSVVAHGVARSSGSPALDEAAIEMIRRASPLPPPPGAVAAVTVTAPVSFRLR